MQHRSDAFVNQQKASLLYRERLLSIIDKQLTDRFGNNDENYQIEKLEVDLGVVRWSEIANVFEEKLVQALSVVKPEKSRKPTGKESPEPTPLKVIAYYLKNGILPWWARESSRDYLHQQLNALLEKPDYAFRELISQMRFQDSQLDRFLNTFSEDQVFRSLQLLTAISLNDLLSGKKEIADIVRQNKRLWSADLSPSTVAKAFWKEAFVQVSVNGAVAGLKSRLLRSVLLSLGAHLEEVAQWSDKEKEAAFDEMDQVRQSAERLKKRHKDNSTWQRFFEHLTEVLHRPVFRLTDPSLLKAIKKGLTELESDQRDPFVSLADEKNRRTQEVLESLKSLEGEEFPSDAKAIVGRILKATGKGQWSRQDLDALQKMVILKAGQKQTNHEFQQLIQKVDALLAWGEISSNRQQAATEGMLRPLAKHLHRIVVDREQTTNNRQRTDTFDEADAISIGNAGLVILWPFLMRFFENLELVEEKAFPDQSAKNKAMCVLQYLVDEREEAFFEGNMPLNKVLCGVPLEDPVRQMELTNEEKEIAIGLLQAVIAQGPRWKNLTIEGLRSSYLSREGLLKSRDGNWLLQVKKETYDITLEQLPWSFRVVKLPWMDHVLMVEWM